MKIPVTQLHKQYLRLKKEPQAERRKVAERFTAEPEELATLFVTSIAELKAYAPSDDAFYPKRRVPLSDRAQRGTTRLVTPLENGGGATVWSVPNDRRLSFRYIGAAAGSTCAPTR